jgi:hypothetical protein
MRSDSGLDLMSPGIESPTPIRFKPTIDELRTELYNLSGLVQPQRKRIKMLNAVKDEASAGHTKALKDRDNVAEECQRLRRISLSAKRIEWFIYRKNVRRRLSEQNHLLRCTMIPQLKAAQCALWEVEQQLTAARQHEQTAMSRLSQVEHALEAAHKRQTSRA